MLSADYNDEQKQLESKLPELNKEIDALNNECTNVQRFLELAKKYTCLTELTPDILRTFISKIVVHERAVKHSKTAPQQIDIYFRYIGNLTAPKSEEVA